MQPFLLLATRAEDVLADNEYESFLRYGGLTEGQLRRVRLERDDLPTLDLAKLSGVILAGSPFTTSIPAAEKSANQVRVEGQISALLDVLVSADFPFLGACYGVGSLGRHQGGLVDFTYGEEVSAPEIRFTPAGRADPISAGIPDTFRSYVGHKEACTRLPASATLLATSDTCPVQLFRVGENLYGTQFHPELDWESLALRIRAYDGMGYFAPGEIEATIAAAQPFDVSDSWQILANFVSRYARP